jgi:hypothetical protein
VVWRVETQTSPAEPGPDTLCRKIVIPAVCHAYPL